MHWTNIGIFYLLVRDEKFTKSAIKCPKKDRYRAIAVSNNKKDELTVFGFVRREWKKSENNEL